MIRFTILSLVFVALLIPLQAGSASAERRVALVIGNSAYRHASQLPNPVNDATAIATLFKNAGFDSVELHQDLGISDMRRVVREFAEEVRDADIAVLYYAGHGIEVNRANYLIPVDAKLASDFDVEDEAFSLDRALKALEPAKRLRLVILDACRDNPFDRTMKRSIGTRAIGRGLAAVEPTTPGTLIAFAAKAGSVAADGNGANSPFTAALIRHIASPGLDLRIAFGRVRDAVMSSTRGAQEPFVYGSLGGSIVSIVGDAAEPSSQTAGTGSPERTSATMDRSPAEWQEYEAAERIGTKEAWRFFLARHKSGFYADLARAAIAKLEAPQPQIDRSQTQPAPQTPIALESLARNFIQEHMRRTEGDPKSIMPYLHGVYAEEIVYFGKRTTKQRVFLDKERYLRNWPQRTYYLHPDTKINCENASSSCVISGLIDFHLVNMIAAKGSSGTAYYEFRVAFSRPGPRIIEETHRTLSRRAESLDR